MYDTKLTSYQVGVKDESAIIQEDHDASLVNDFSIMFIILASGGKITQQTKLTSFFQGEFETTTVLMVDKVFKTFLLCLVFSQL